MSRDLSQIPDDDLILEDLQIFTAMKEFRLASLGDNALNVVLDRLDLVSFYRYFLENNQSDAPYHNNYHARCMMLNCFEGAYHEKLTPSETRALVAAAMFHDFNHSGGRTDDVANIVRALSGLNSVWLMSRAHIKNWDDSLTETELELAVQAIRITKYPYERSPVTPLEMLIRDADLMQPYEENDSLLRQQYLGLKAEVETFRKTTFTDAEYADGQSAWLNAHVTWYTPWANRKAEVLDWEARKRHLVDLLRA